MIRLTRNDDAGTPAMSINEYLELRVRNGKITIPDINVHTGKKNENPDSEYIKQYGINMSKFWDNAKTQKALLWAMRGLGLDFDADALWKVIAKTNNVVLHQTVLSLDQTLHAANFIRNVYKNPFRSREYTSNNCMAIDQLNSFDQ